MKGDIIMKKLQPIIFICVLVVFVSILSGCFGKKDSDDQSNDNVSDSMQVITTIVETVVTTTIPPVDTKPPEVSIDYEPSNPTSDEKIKFIAKADDESGIGETKILVDGNIVETADDDKCTFKGGPYQKQKTVSFSAIAFDKAGNKATTKTQTIEIKDVTKPTVDISVGKKKYTDKDKVTFYATSSDNIDLEKTIIIINGEGKDFYDKSIRYNAGPFPAGVVEYRAIVTDKAGNSTETKVAKLHIEKSATAPKFKIPKLGISPTCEKMVQGKIAWDYKGSKTWNPTNVNRLCKGAEKSAEPAKCFKRVMHGGINWGGGTQWAWKNALDLCEGTLNANATIGCFQAKIQAGIKWPQAIKDCDRR